MKRGPKVRPAPERFERLVDRSGGPDACHPWLGHRHRGGHGQFNVGDDVRVYAHRYAFEQHMGRPVAEGMDVLHRPVICHNPGCCNGAHLYEGTDTENTRDKYVDGTVPIGESHWRAAGVKGRPGPILPGKLHGNTSKLTERDIPVIRALVLWSGFSYRDVADEYGITSKNVGHIVRLRTWKNVPGVTPLTTTGS